MKVQTVSAAKVPKQDRQSRVAERKEQYDAAIATLRAAPTDALRIVIEDGDTERQVRLRLQRAAIRADIEIKTTLSEDGKIVYAQYKHPPSRQRRAS